MSLRERVYSVLVVSASQSFQSALTALLPETRYDPVLIVGSVSAAKRAAAERAFDFVVVNAPLPDDSGLHFSIDTCTTRGTVVLLLVRADQHAAMHEKAAAHGVFTLPKPLSRAAMATALDWMGSARERLRAYEEKTLSIEEKMQQIRLVNRAKWFLISELHMTEPEAHRYIEKQAMDRCVAKQQVAEEIIKTYT